MGGGGCGARHRPTKRLDLTSAREHEIVNAKSRRCIEIQITCGSQAEADAISRELVDRRLAACVQQLPIRSVYRWEGEVQHDEEFLLLAKSRADLGTGVRDLVIEQHSYDVAAITWVDIVGGSDAYLDWIYDETTDRNDAPS
jgi:periplasmic divalent cation tolerance protein